MRDWKLRDTVMVIFMLIVVVVMFMQMVQNDRLYERLNDTIRLIESGSYGTVASTRGFTGNEWIVPDAEPGGAAIIHYNAQPPNLNPVTYKDAYAGLILGKGGAYQSLLKRDAQTLELVGELAESWSISEDKLKITFKVKPDARWSDGRPVTARDIEFGYRVMMLPAVDAQRSQTYYVDCESVEAKDDRTLVFTWKKEYFKSLEQSGGVTALPRHVIDPEGQIDTDPEALAERINEWNWQWNDGSPVTSGPYLIEAWDKVANRVYMKRNERYWGAKSPLQRLVFRFITNDDAALQSLKAEELDAMGLTAEQWHTQTGEDAFLNRFEKHKYLRVTAGYNYFGWNNRRAPFDDRLVRQAMSYCIPRELIKEKIFYDLRELANGPFFINGKQANPEISQWPYDPKKAESLLSNAGFADSDGDGVLDRAGKPFVFKMIMPSGSPAYEQILSLVQDELAKIGVKMEIDPYEWSVFVERLDERNYDACVLGWGGTVEGDPYQIWHSTSFQNKGSNHIGYKNEEVDRLIEGARQEFDQQKRNAMYHRVHAILFEEQPYTWLFTGPSLLTYSKRLRNVQATPLGLYYTEWWIPIRERRSAI